MRKIVFIGAIALLAASCSGKSKDIKVEKQDKQVVAQTGQSGELKIAYYVLDSLANSFEIYKREQATIEKEGKTLNDQMVNLQKEYQSEYGKYEAGMRNQTLTQNQITSFEQRLGALQQRLGEFQNTKLAAFQEKQYKATEVINNKIIKYAQEFGEDNNLTLFLAAGSASNISYANKGLDMTNAFVAFMNSEESKIGH